MYYSYIVFLVIFFISYFPAFLWYQEHYARVGYLFTIGFALTAYIPWVKYISKWRIALALISIWWLLIETIGIITCFPYGCFNYSEQLWPKIIGWAPRLLLATYPPLVLWVYQYVKKLNFSWRKSRIGGWIWLMLVDLILDPIAIQMWLWSYPGWWFWFGVPLSNFLGRILSGTIATLILDIVLQKNYTHRWVYTLWLKLTLVFFIWYAIWKIILW